MEQTIKNTTYSEMEDLERKKNVVLVIEKLIIELKGKDYKLARTSLESAKTCLVYTVNKEERRILGKNV